MQLFGFAFWNSCIHSNFDADGGKLDETLGAYLFLSPFISINSHKYFDTNVVFILMTKGRIK